MSEPIREDETSYRGNVPPPRRDVPPQPLRPIEERGPAFEERRLTFEAFGLRDFVHWAPVWGGMFISIALLILLAPLGVALGLSSATGAAIWGAIMLIVAFFVGGWIVGRTLSFDDPLIAGAHGLLSWAVALSFLLLMTAFLGTIGAVGAAGAANPSGLVPSIAVPGGSVASASWGTFIALLLGAIAACAGAVVGNQGRTYLRRMP